MDPLLILEQVNAFYSNAFSHLLTTTLIILGFGSVVLPLVFQSLQFRSFREERENLKSQINHEIKKELDSEIKNLFQIERENIQKQLEEELLRIKNQQEEQALGIKGGTFFLQANSLIDKKQYFDAAENYVFASKLLIQGKDEMNGQRTLKILTDDCMPKLTKNDFEDNPDFNKTVDDLLKTLSDLNENGRYSDSMRDITIGRTKAMIKEPVIKK